MQELSQNNTGVVKLGVKFTPENIEKFSILVNTGIQFWIEAGKLLVAMIDDNPETKSLILESNPTLSMDSLVAFEKIGRRQVTPYMLLETCVASKRLITMPIEVQEQCLKEPVEVVTAIKKNGHVSRKIGMRSLTQVESDLVFSEEGKVRTVDEQIAHLNTPQPKEVGEEEITRPRMRLIRSLLAEESNNQSAAPSALNPVEPTLPQEVTNFISLGRFSFGKTPWGQIIMQKTPAKPHNITRVVMFEGFAFIEFVEIEKSPDKPIPKA